MRRRSSWRWRSVGSFSSFRGWRRHPPRGVGERATPTPEITQGGSSEQAELAPARDRVLAAGDAELAEHRARVRLDGVERDVELGADLALREVGGQQPQHGDLALAQLAVGRLRRLARRAERALD